MATRIDMSQVRDFADRGQTVFRTVSAQPGWVTRLALYTFVIVIGLPILLLTIVALCAAIIVFGVLVVANALIMRLRGAMPRDDGRRNVRVIQRRD